MMRRIGIEGLAFDKVPSGVGKYFLNLVSALVEAADSDTVFFVYSNKDVYLPQAIRDRVTIVQDQSSFSKLNRIVWLKLRAGSIIKKDKIDYYLSALGFFPFLPAAVKKVGVVHDLNYRIVPHTMGKLHFLSHYFFLKRDVRKADFIVTNTAGTAAKIERYFNRKADTIINPPVRPVFNKLPQAEVDKVLQQYKIKDPYLLAVGTIEPRKNLLTTIRVFLNLLEQQQNDGHKLILVGSIGWNQHKEIMKLCTTHEKDIKILGYVKEEDLPALYNGATAFLFPSLYEGFGIPVREALQCATPVITSDTAELRESGLNSAIYINPADMKAYKQAIRSILKQPYQVKDFSSESIKHNKMESFLHFFLK